MGQPATEVPRPKTLKVLWQVLGRHGEKRVYTTTVGPLFSRSVARPRGHRAKKTMVYTIFLGKQGKMVYTVGPERRVYTIEPQSRKKKKGGSPRWWCVLFSSLGRGRPRTGCSGKRLEKCLSLICSRRAATMPSTSQSTPLLAGTFPSTSQSTPFLAGTFASASPKNLFGLF